VYVGWYRALAMRRLPVTQLSVMIRKWHWVLTLVASQWKVGKFLLFSQQLVCPLPHTLCRCHSLGLIHRVKFVEWLLEHMSKASDAPVRLRLLLPVFVEYLPSVLTCQSTSINTKII
jgi:hypothetical protein